MKLWKLLEKRLGPISCTAKQSPKKDGGQSPLQAALKAGRPDIAEYLPNLRANVDFIKAEDCVLAPELKADLRRIFTLLYECGMDTGRIKPGEALITRKFYRDEPVAQFLTFCQTSVPFPAKNPHGPQLILQ